MSKGNVAARTGAQAGLVLTVMAVRKSPWNSIKMIDLEDLDSVCDDNALQTVDEFSTECGDSDLDSDISDITLPPFGRRPRTLTVCANDSVQHVKMHCHDTGPKPILGIVSTGTPTSSTAASSPGDCANACASNSRQNLSSAAPSFTPSTLAQSAQSSSTAEVQINDTKSGEGCRGERAHSSESAPSVSLGGCAAVFIGDKDDDAVENHEWEAMDFASCAEEKRGSPGRSLLSSDAPLFTPNMSAQAFVPTRHVNGVNADVKCSSAAPTDHAVSNGSCDVAWHGITANTNAASATFQAPASKLTLSANAPIFQPTSMLYGQRVSQSTHGTERKPSSKAHMRDSVTWERTLASQTSTAEARPYAKFSQKAAGGTTVGSANRLTPHYWAQQAAHQARLDAEYSKEQRLKRSTRNPQPRSSTGWWTNNEDKTNIIEVATILNGRDWPKDDARSSEVWNEQTWRPTASRYADTRSSSGSTGETWHTTALREGETRSFEGWYDETWQATPSRSDDYENKNTSWSSDHENNGRWEGVWQ